MNISSAGGGIRPKPIKNDRPTPPEGCESGVRAEYSRLRRKAQAVVRDPCSTGEDVREAWAAAHEAYQRWQRAFTPDGKHRE